MTSLRVSKDALTVLGLAGSALPFAQSIDDEVERWLRPLRLYGESGGALQAVGVSEAPLKAASGVAPKTSQTTPEETLHIVTTAASELAAERGATAVGTRDLLIAVMHHYGEAFERALQNRSSDSAEVIDRLVGHTQSA